MRFRRPNWTRPLPRPLTRVPFGVRTPRGLGIYLASAVFFNGPRVNAVAVAVCVAILFAIESPTQDVSTVQPEETPRAQREDTPSPTPPPDDPFSTSSIDLVMGSPIQDFKSATGEKTLERAAGIPSAMASPDDPVSTSFSNAQREDTPSPAAPPDDPVSTSSIGYLGGTAGQPLCVRRDALAAMLSRACLALIKRKGLRSAARQ